MRKLLDVTYAMLFVCVWGGGLVVGWVGGCTMGGVQSLQLCIAGLRARCSSHRSDKHHAHDIILRVPTNM